MPRISKEENAFKKRLFVILVVVLVLGYPGTLSSSDTFVPHAETVRSRTIPSEPSRQLVVGYTESAHYQVIATTYTARDPGMDGKGITFSGAMVQECRTLAVDPAVIPLGSLVYVPYFKDRPNAGWFVAEDTGSAIRGKKIDIYIPLRKDALEFGVKPLHIHVFRPR